MLKASDHHFYLRTTMSSRLTSAPRQVFLGDVKRTIPRSYTQTRHALVATEVSHLPAFKVCYSNDNGAADAHRNEKSRAKWPHPSLPTNIQPSDFRLSLPDGVGIPDFQQETNKIEFDQTTNAIMSWIDSTDAKNTTVLKETELFAPECNSPPQNCAYGLVNAIRSSERKLSDAGIEPTLNWEQKNTYMEQFEKETGKSSSCLDMHAFIEEEESAGHVITKFYDSAYAKPELMEFCQRSDIRLDYHVNKHKLLERDLINAFKPKAWWRQPRDLKFMITVAFETKHDMSGWDDASCVEREAKQAEFVKFAKQLCQYIQQDGVFADFIDPKDGLPWLSKAFIDPQNKGISQTHPGFAQLDNITVDQEGCCPVLSYNNFGRNVFVGTIVTDCEIYNNHETFQEMLKYNEQARGASSL